MLQHQHVLVMELDSTLLPLAMPRLGLMALSLVTTIGVLEGLDSLEVEVLLQSERGLRAHPCQQHED